MAEEIKHKIIIIIIIIIIRKTKGITNVIVKNYSNID